MAKYRVKTKNVFRMVGIIVLAVVLLVILAQKKNNKVPDKVITDFKGMSISEVERYCKENNIVLKTTYDYNEEILKDVIMDSSLIDKKASVSVSKGAIPYNLYEEKGVNELGRVPIMMYHGIINTTTNKYTGGNVDKDGYNRTSNAFREDLEFYYQNGYRMVRLIDYTNGIIDVELGYSPIVLTFDDGNQNNINILGKDENGNLQIDPNSAIGILEEFKKKYPDFNVTATFFVTSALFNQKQYNAEILTWLVEHGYDVGNHTTGHNNLSDITTSKTNEVIGKMYQVLDDYIPGKYVHIVALPFGSPYQKTHANYAAVLKGNYNDYEYETASALRVGWESEVSPFNKNFDKTFLKRCRAYDNDGQEFDITMVFKTLKTKKYISDGDPDTIVIKNNDSSLNENLKNTYRVITY